MVVYCIRQGDDLTWSSAEEGVSWPQTNVLFSVNGLTSTRMVLLIGSSFPLVLTVSSLAGHFDLPCLYFRDVPGVVN